MSIRYTDILNISLFIVVFFVAAKVATAADINFVPLVTVPGINYSNPDFEALIRIFYIIAIVAAAFLAVGKLILAGFSYVTSSLVSTKSNAKDDIQNALIGLLIILAAVAVLNTINPKLTNLPSSLDAIDVPTPSKPTARTVRVGRDSGAAVDDLRKSCTKLIKYTDGRECCNDDGACTPPSTSTSLIGLSTDRNTYTTSEIDAVVDTNNEVFRDADSSKEIIDLGRFSTPESEEQIGRLCEITSERRRKTVSEVIVLNQIETLRGVRNVVQRPLCIIE